MADDPRAATAKTAELKLRIPEPLRHDIETAAKAKGIAMNAEMIGRLGGEQSLTELITRLFGGPRTSEILRQFAHLSRIGIGEPDQWLDDYKAFIYVTDVWNRNLLRHRPPAPKEVDDYYAGAKRAIDRLLIEPDPQISATMESTRERRIAEHLFVVRCVVGHAAEAGLDADQCAELRRLFADAERELTNGFGPPPATKGAAGQPERTAPTEPPQPDPADLERWDRAFDRARVRRAEGTDATPAIDGDENR